MTEAEQYKEQRDHLGSTLYAIALMIKDAGRPIEPDEDIAYVLHEILAKAKAAGVFAP